MNCSVCVRSTWRTEQVKSDVSLLIFLSSINIISTVKSGMLTSSTTLLTVLQSLFGPIITSFMYLGAPMLLCIYIYYCDIYLLNWSHYHCTMGLSFIVFDLMSVLSDTSILLLLFWFPFAWDIFYCFSFRLCVSLQVKTVLQAAYTWVLFSFLYSVTLCLMIREFNSFTFKVIIERYRFTTTI